MHTTRQKGLRNRFRNGRGTYSKARKGTVRDRYGIPDNRGDVLDFIADKALRYRLGKDGDDAGTA